MRMDLNQDELMQAPASGRSSEVSSRALGGVAFFGPGTRASSVLPPTKRAQHSGKRRRLRCRRCAALWWRPISVLRFWNSEGLTQAESYFKGWNSHVQRKFPGNVESTNLSRDNLRREIGRIPTESGPARQGCTWRPAAGGAQPRDRDLRGRNMRRNSAKEQTFERI